MRQRSYIAGLLLLCLSATSADANPSIVVDVETGKVLAHEEAFQRWYPASITKIMTAYMAFEAVRSGELSMRSPVRITKRAAAEPPSKMGYPVGTELTLENALKIMLVKSANDIAMAIGEAVGGTRDKFMAMMNERAAELGMTDTHFVNPHGLPEKGQYTTARDFGLLAAHVRREFPQYAGIFSIEALKLPGRGAPVRNTNILIGRMAGADGMKTGYICASGFNLVASATREGRTIVAVVLGALDQQVRAEKAADLLAAGFQTDPATVQDTVQTLPRGGDDGTDVADISNDICTGRAQLDRYDGRDVDGKFIYRSSNIEPMRRDPVTVAVSLGGADGPPARNTGLVDIPVAQPRPTALRDLALETAASEKDDSENTADDPEDTALSSPETSAASAAMNDGPEADEAAETEGDEDPALPTPPAGMPLPQSRPDAVQ
ncbi:D-alanyl-D-alanine carboxypeptidase [Notoacmeibacter ruber]|uniref:D-alanyl-D-alanine carboxypeptidase n=1 Tax=Notoacmeibacter ruber TaxID=2670375 RepID=A0A3L7JD93_9HYPH|nr:D-alanyl-D-alanine carboxypeptidase family protein [Notoacmeibacter ruber]RLQ88646.1 D-alanyl-D-alanine carboxypeptidase [Notoacmeibacter ruber]